MRVGVGEIAGAFVFGRGGGEKGKGIDILVAVLPLAFFVIDRSPVQPRGRARLEASDMKAELYEIIGQRGGGGKAVRPRLLDDGARDCFRIEIDPRAEHDGAAADNPAVGGFDPRALPVLDEDFSRFALKDTQAVGMLQRPLHFAVIGVFVRLGPKALYRRALADVEHAQLKRGFVRVQPHFSAQSVYLAHEMALGGAADRGIAGHKADAVEV